jgi:hypothetical protein
MLNIAESVTFFTRTGPHFARPQVRLPSPSLNLVHTQLATPLKIDNSTALGILNETMKPKCLKATDIQLARI